MSKVAEKGRACKMTLGRILQAYLAWSESPTTTEDATCWALRNIQITLSMAGFLDVSRQHATAAGREAIDAANALASPQFRAAVFAWVRLPREERGELLLTLHNEIELLAGKADDAGSLRSHVALRQLLDAIETTLAEVL